jgi:ribosome-associated protein
MGCWYEVDATYAEDWRKTNGTKNRISDFIMLRITPSLVLPESEIQFRFSRSGGPGGQHVNKASTRVELLFDVAGSRSLSDDQRQRIAQRLKRYLGSDGILRVVCDASRSQWQNRATALEKFVALLQTALARRKKRVATRPPTSASEQRSKEKQIRSRKKALRRRVGAEDS